MCSDERAMGKERHGRPKVPVTWPVPQGTIASSPPWKEQQGSASNWKIKMRINIKIHTLFSLQNELVPVRLPNDVLRTCYTSSLQHSARCWMTTIMTSNCCARSLADSSPHWNFRCNNEPVRVVGPAELYPHQTAKPTGIDWRSRLICVHT